MLSAPPPPPYPHRGGPLRQIPVGGSGCSPSDKPNGPFTAEKQKQKAKVHTGAPASNQHPRSLCPARLLGLQIFGDAEVKLLAIWQPSGAAGRTSGARRCCIATRWDKSPAFDLHGEAVGPAGGEKKDHFAWFCPKICTLRQMNMSQAQYQFGIFYNQY